MTHASSNDLDYLATRLHARRSRMAEDGRLVELAGARTTGELGRMFFPGTEPATVTELQRQWVTDLAGEVSSSLKHLDENAQALVAWQLTRFQLENAKVLLRGFLTHQPLEALRPHLISLPRNVALDENALLSSKSLLEFVHRLPLGRPRNRLTALLATQPDTAPIFLLEAALDCGYFQELLARSDALPSGEDRLIKPLLFQEANMFQFFMVARGKLHFGFAAETLRRLQLVRSGTDPAWFDDLLSASDVLTMAKRSVGIVLDSVQTAPGSNGAAADMEVSWIERKTWQRYLRLANYVFRCSHMGPAAVAAYFCLRRVEISNLISLSEGIRLGIDKGQLRERAISRSELEVANV